MDLWNGSTPLSADSFNRHLAAGLYGAMEERDRVLWLGRFEGGSPPTFTNIAGFAGDGFSLTRPDYVGRYVLDFPTEAFEEVPFVVPQAMDSSENGVATLESLTATGCVIKTWKMVTGLGASPADLEDTRLTLLGRRPEPFWRDESATPLTAAALNRLVFGGEAALRVVGCRVAFDGADAALTSNLGFSPRVLFEASSGTYTVFFRAPFVQGVSPQVVYLHATAFGLAGIDTREKERLRFRVLDGFGSPLTAGEVLILAFGR
jgi:hypothetical protein